MRKGGIQLLSKTFFFIVTVSAVALHFARRRIDPESFSKAGSPAKEVIAGSIGGELGLALVGLP